jgi:hypothetical protein
MKRKAVKTRDLYAARLEDWRDLIDTPQERAAAFDGDERLERMLTPEEFEPSLRRAEEYLRLDRADPWLLRVLADVLFHDRKKGRPKRTKRRDLDFLVQLDVDRRAVEKDHPAISDRKAAGEIKKRYDRYKHITERTIRESLKDARGHHRMAKYFPAKYHWSK